MKTQETPVTTPDQEDWRDMTVVASAFEQQFEIYTARLRHRQRRLYVGKRPIGAPRGVGEWQPGPAPDTNLASGS